MTKQHLSFLVERSGVGMGLLCSQSSSPPSDPPMWAANQGRSWGTSSSPRQQSMAGASHCWSLWDDSPWHHTMKLGEQRAGSRPSTPKMPSPWPVQCSPAQLQRDGSLPSSAVKGNYHIRKGNPLNINTRINLHIIQSPGDSCLQPLFLTHGKAAHLGPYHSGKKAQDVCKGWGQFWDWSFAISLLNVQSLLLNRWSHACGWLPLFWGTI